MSIVIHLAHAPARPPSRYALAWLCVCLVPTLVACGDDGTNVADTDTNEVDVAVPGPFTIAIEASALTGNVPQKIRFEARSDIALDRLALSWFIDDQPFTTDPSFEIVFNRAGQTKVVVVAELIGSEGEPDSRQEATVTVQLLGCGQLRFDRFSLDSPTEVPPGGVARVRVGSLVNDGDRIDTPFAVGLALSLDDRYEPAEDPIVDRYEVPGMGSGLSTTSEVDLSGRAFVIPEDFATADYFAFLVADPDGVVNECQELDNHLVASNILVVDPAAGLLPDLRIDDVAVAPGTVVSQGQSLTFTFAITNDGEADARQFRYGFWISEDTTLDPEVDRVIAPPSDDINRIQVMPAGLSLGFFKSWTVPDDLPDGDYYIIGRVDALETVAESDEDNNRAVSATTFVMRFEEPDCYDFALSNLRVAPLTTYWGGTVQVTVVVRNDGSRDAPAGNIMRAYLSLEPTLSPANAQVLGNFVLGDVPAGNERTFDFIVPIGADLPVLPHFLGVVLDPTNAFAECTESNNAGLFGDPVRINALAQVDLVVPSLAYHPRTVVAGASIKADFTVENRGTTVATTFALGVVLSRDATIDRAGITSGADVVVDRITVPLLPPGESRSFIRDIVIPAGLDHGVEGWHVAVLADLDGFITSDINPGNNLRVAAELLTVTGALGGCFEDTSENNNSRAAAQLVAPGRVAELGSCGNEDWFLVDVPTGRSLFVEVSGRAIVSVPATPSDLVVELYGPDNVVVSSVSAGPSYRLYAFGVGAPGSSLEPGAYAIRVVGATARDRASYDLDLALRSPQPGADLIPHEVVSAPVAAYAGGRLITRWREANFGLATAAAHTGRVWLSRNRELEPATDVLLGSAALGALGSLQTAVGEVNALLSPTLAPGIWYALVESDAGLQVAESDEANNVAVSAPIFLDPLKICADDALEPNDERVIATVVTAPASTTYRDVVVCPTLDDWYAFDLVLGDALDADISYNYEASKGRLLLELYAPGGEGAVVSDARNGLGRVLLPYAWRAGRWYVRVANDPAVSAQLPYTYELDALRSRGAPTLMCGAERYEPNDSQASAARIGCGETRGSLCNADVDWYRLPGLAGQRLTVTTNHTSNQFLLQLFLPGTTNAAGSVFGTGSMGHTPTADGPVLLRVSPRLGVNTMTTFEYGFAVTGIDGAEVAVDDFFTDLDALDRGEDLRLDFVVENPCTLPAPAFEVTAWLSLDETVDLGDVPLVSLAEAGLAPGAAMSFTPKVQVPLSTAPGVYWVLVEADSGQAIDESNELDNTAAVQVEVREPCRPDRFEPNDSQASAASLVPSEQAGLALCPFDQDWFAIAAPAGATWDIGIMFSHTDGDLDLRVYDPLVSASLPIATSTSSTDDEAVTVTTPLATTLFVRVNGYGGQSAGYALEVLRR